VVLDREVPIEIGRIVYFLAPNDNRPCVKRVERINEEGDLWVAADNKGWTGEDSDQYGWVSADRVVGTVTSIWSLSQLLNNQRVNELSLRYSPHDFAVVDQNNYAIDRNGRISVVRDGEEIARAEGDLVKYDGRVLQYDTGIDNMELDVITHTTSFINNMDLFRLAMKSASEGHFKRVGEGKFSDGNIQIIIVNDTGSLRIISNGRECNAPMDPELMFSLP